MGRRESEMGIAAFLRGQIRVTLRKLPPILGFEAETMLLTEADTEPSKSEF